MNDKMISCKTCGKEIAKSAKKCPSCGEGYLVEHVTKNGVSKICTNKECNYKEEINGERNESE